MLQMCDKIPRAIIKMDDVKRFFSERWAPEVNKISQPGGGALDDMFDDILDQMVDLDVCEVK